MRLLRAAIWYNYGRSRFTKSGFEANSRDFDPSAIPSSLDGRVYVVTGANAGIGKATTAAFASRGATVHMLCRNEERGEQAREDIARLCAKYDGETLACFGDAHSIDEPTEEKKKGTGKGKSRGKGDEVSDASSSSGSSSSGSSSSGSSSSGSSSDSEVSSDSEPLSRSRYEDVLSRLHVHVVDVSSLEAVRTFARATDPETETETGRGGQDVPKIRRLDALVNNAGCMIPKRKLIDAAGRPIDGGSRDALVLDANFATNVLGPALLTELLLPRLFASRGRVVTVSSGGMLTEAMDAKDPQLLKWSHYDGTRAYAQNKRLQIYLTAYWAKAYESLLSAQLSGKRKTSPPAQQQHKGQQQQQNKGQQQQQQEQQNKGQQQQRHGPPTAPDVEIGGIRGSVSFAACHPGWADTDSVRTAMPDFHKRMEGRLRDASGGADTVVWLSTNRGSLADAEHNGRFFFDRAVVETHLTGCFTRSSIDDIELVWEKLHEWMGLQADPVRGAAAFAHALP